LINSSAPTVALRPAAIDEQFLGAGPIPPTQDACGAVGRRCFNPTSIQNSYNLTPLYAANQDGRGQTIAIIDSFGSVNMAHDLHVFDSQFGVQAMCGEEAVTCTGGMPTFSILHVQGSPAPVPSGQGKNGTGTQNRSAWALEVSLDVEWAHSVAPKANILLVTTPVAETQGVQGLTQMMNAEQYVIDNHLATVISQSFGTTEENLNGNIEPLRHAFKSAPAAGVTVLASSGDGGTANASKTPTKTPSTYPFATVIWPSSDPLVTSVEAPTSAPTRLSAE
jgi:subtilase family serine protease